MELDLKTKEYHVLCNKLEELKQQNIDPNSSKLLKLRNLFEKNQQEIAEINKKMKEQI